MEQKKPCSNTHPCECPYGTCNNHGTCCACVAYHKAAGDLPMCLRPAE